MANHSWLYSTVFMWCSLTDTSTHEKYRHFGIAFMRQTKTTFHKRYCTIPAMNVKLYLIGWFERSSANDHRAYIKVDQKLLLLTTRPLASIQSVNFTYSLIWHRYHIHVPIYHIFELQFAELPECIARWRKSPGCPLFRIRYCGTLHTAKPVVRLRPTPESSRTLPNNFRDWPSGTIA
jgi:hypothetical protein